MIQPEPDPRYRADPLLVVVNYVMMANAVPVPQRVIDALDELRRERDAASL